MLAHLKRGLSSPGRQRAALLWLLALLLLAATLPLALYWSKQWLWPERFHLKHTTYVVAAWLVLLAASLIPLKKQGASHLLWATYLAQWVVVYRSGSWTLGVLSALCCAWLLSGRSIWRLGASVVVSCLALLIAGYERLYGPVTPDAMAAVLQTSAQEAGGFVFQHLSVVVLSMFVVMLITQISLFFLRPSLAPIQFRTSLPFAAVLVLFGSAGQLERLQAAHASLEDIRIQDRSMARVSTGDVRVAVQEPLDVVLMIGESNSRWHWQLYGYPGRTTPQLEAMRNELIVFKDVVSANSHTVPSLTAMFYRPYRDEQRPLQLQQVRKVSVLDALKSGGVDTVWLSAQAPYGPWASAVSNLAQLSNRAEFFNRGSEGRLSPQALIGDPDLLARDAVIQALRSPATNPRRLIVQHMLAPHFPYCKYGNSAVAFPEVAFGAAYFGSAEDLSSDVACYDRGVHFTDQIIKDVLRAAEANARPTVVVFVPDHGEAPEEGTGHNNSAFSSRHVEIPMVMHFNTAARSSMSAAYAALAVNASKPVLNSWVGELLLDLFHVSVKGLEREIGPLLDPGFSGPARSLFRDSLPLQYDLLTYDGRKDPLALTRLTLQEVKRQGGTMPIYAHRINSQAKALEAKQYFDGIEMDLMFDPRRRVFDVYHPPAAATGLTLDMQLQAVADKPALQLWFDFKNPPSDDTASVLQVLETIDARWHVKHRTVLELPAGAAGQMRAYSDAGWRVSYYVPGGFGSCGETRNSTDCEKQARQIVSEALAARAVYLSFDYGSFPAISNYVLPHQGKLKLLSWTWIDSTTNGLPAALAEYPRFDGLIIPFKSRFSY